MSRRRGKGAADFVSEEPAPTAPPEDRALRTRPIRITVDLTPADHRALTRWCNAAALDLDMTTVHLAAVVRALSAELTEGQLPELGERVRARLTRS